MTTTTDEISSSLQSYSDIIDARGRWLNNYNAAKGNLERAEYALAIRKAQMIANNAGAGSNEAMRNANLVLALDEDEYATVYREQIRTAETLMADADRELTLGRARERLLQHTLTLLEPTRLGEAR